MLPSTSPSEPWLGVVLAGGESRRMGTDKALLRLRGRALLDQMCELMRNAGASGVIVSGDRPGWQGIPDATAGRGPLGGVATVLTANPGARLLFVAVDMPRLTPGLLRTLAHEAGAADVVHFDDQPLPLLLQATPGVCAAAHALLDGPPPRSLRRLVDGLPARSLPLPEDAASALFNANTPADWAEVIHEAAS